MMRTIEILLVIIIITGAFVISSFFTTLPLPRQVSPSNLRRLAFTTLQTLDTDHSLGKTVFEPTNSSEWSELEIALTAVLPPNFVYNLTVYQILTGGPTLYSPVKSISNAESLGIGSDASTYLVASSNASFGVTAEKVGESYGGITLYILNCSDANGWWITGYTSQKLAADLYDLLSPYFQTTIVVQNTSQLGNMLNGTSIQGEKLQDAIVINTFGEAVPIPSGYYSSPGVGYDTGRSSYSLYCYTLGQRVRRWNWTWVSIVGWPLYYVSNTVSLASSQNSWGIYGMVNVTSPGLQSFLQGLDNQSYSFGNSQTNSTGIVYLSQQAQYYSNYYGIYPSYYQTATRALSNSILTTYHLNVTTYIFDPVANWIAGAVYRNQVSGALMSLGLTRTPDIRLTALGLLTDYKPRIYGSDQTVTGTSRLVILQLGQAGGL
jgi:hypothetical protein